MRLKLALTAGVSTLMMSVAFAQTAAPVIYASDPGEAMPRSEVDAALAEAGASTTIESGAFDYGAADAPAATEGPEMLLSYDDAAYIADPEVLETETEIRTAQAEVSSPYQQDPIYQVTEAAETTLAAYKPEAIEGWAIEVGPGDTVYALGRKYAVHPNEIIAANNLSAPYLLEVGQHLIIPSEASAESMNAAIAAPAPAPVAIIETAEMSPAPQLPVAQPVAYAAPATAQVYEVQPGNTLYSISRSFGLDVATVAKANNLSTPYTLSIGQQLIIPGAAPATAVATPSPAIASTPAAPANSGATTGRNTYIDPAERSASAAPATSIRRETSAVVTPEKDLALQPAPIATTGQFTWPVEGKVIMGFGLDENGRRNDGINIAAPVGTPVRTVGDGEVVYRGTDLEGYGNLLLIKHADGWVSAYAHTDAILVEKGDKVTRGQVVAKVGRTGTVTQPQLHFELRHDLKPTNPVASLEARKDLASYRPE